MCDFLWEFKAFCYNIRVRFADFYPPSMRLLLAQQPETVLVFTQQAHGFSLHEVSRIPISLFTLDRYLAMRAILKKPSSRVSVHVG